MRPSINSWRSLALAAALATLLAACSQYLARRDTISLDGGNALAGNQAVQVVDPWPRASADRNIAFNGERMQAAVARYRADQVIAPVGTGTSASYSQANSAAPGAPANNNTPLGPQINQQAVK
jgi:hypothetical protein